VPLPLALPHADLDQQVPVLVLAALLFHGLVAVAAAAAAAPAAAAASALAGPAGFGRRRRHRIEGREDVPPAVPEGVGRGQEAALQPAARAGVEREGLREAGLRGRRLSEPENNQGF
jgi:hypothetical protein